MRFLMICSLIFIGSGFAPATSAFASSDSELNGRCTGGRDSKACYELAMSKLKAGNRAEARRFFQVGCTAEKKKSCTKSELKSVAKSFASTTDRIPASKKR